LFSWFWESAFKLLFHILYYVLTRTSPRSFLILSSSYQNRFKYPLMCISMFTHIHIKIIVKYVNVNIYRYMYTYIFIRIHMYIETCTFAHIYITCIYLNKLWLSSYDDRHLTEFRCLYMYLHLFICVWIYYYTYICIGINKHTSIYVLIHLYISIYVCTYDDRHLTEFLVHSTQIYIYVHIHI
jgi:hypothetical protein